MAEVEMTEEELNKRLNHAHWGGRAAACEFIAKELYGRAGDLFACGNDADARAVREAAAGVKSQGQIERQKQNEFK